MPRARRSVTTRGRGRSRTTTERRYCNAQPHSALRRNARRRVPDGPGHHRRSQGDAGHEADDDEAHRSTTCSTSRVAIALRKTSSAPHASEMIENMRRNVIDSADLDAGTDTSRPRTVPASGRRIATEPRKTTPHTNVASTRWCEVGAASPATSPIAACTPTISNVSHASRPDRSCVRSYCHAASRHDRRARRWRRRARRPCTRRRRRASDRTRRVRSAVPIRRGSIVPETRDALGLRKQQASGAVAFRVGHGRPRSRAHATAGAPAAARDRARRAGRAPCATSRASPDGRESRVP